MQLLNGFQLARQIRKYHLNKLTPTIFIAETRARVKELLTDENFGGLFDYILEPIIPKIILTKAKFLIQWAKDREKINQQAAQLEGKNQQLQQEILTRQITENIKEVFYIAKIDPHQILYISPAVTEIWGLPPEQFYHNPNSWLDVIHPKDRERISSNFEIDSKRGNFHQEYRIIRPDGELRWIRFRGFPIKDSNGRIYRFAGIGSDITAAKLVEAALIDSERRYATLAQASPVGIFHADIAIRNDM